MVDRGMTTSMPHRSWTVKEKAVVGGSEASFRARARCERGDKGRIITSGAHRAVLGRRPKAVAGPSFTLSHPPCVVAFVHAARPRRSGAMPVGVTAAMSRALERTVACVSDMLAIFGVA